MSVVYTVVVVVAFLIVVPVGLKQGAANIRDAGRAEPGVWSKTAKVGAPVFVCGVAGLILFGIGDSTNNTPMFVVGIVLFAIALCVWVPFVLTRIRALRAYRDGQ